MAVAFRSVAAAASATGTEPAGAAANDVLIAIAANESGSNAPAVPSGWTSLQEDDDVGFGVFSFTACWIRRGGSAPSLAFTGADHVAIAAYSGAKTTGSPVNATAYTKGNQSPTCPSVTTTVNNCMIVGAIGKWSWAALTPNQWANERLDQAAAGPLHMFDDGLLAVAGATGTIAATGSGDVSGNITIAIEPEAGGGATDLVVADLTVTSVADAPTLTQVHNLTVSDLTVAAVVDAPTLTQVHSLTVTDLTVSVVADTPTLTQVHVLAVADLVVASVIDAPVLTQVHQLAVTDLVVATTIDTVTLVAAGDLVVADLTVATTIDAPTLTQVHQLAVSDLIVATVIGAPALTQVHTLVVADLTVVTTVESVTLSTEAILDVEDLTVATVIDVPTLTQVHVLTVADLTVTPAIDTPALTQVHNLTVASLAVIAFLDVITLIAAPLADDVYQAVYSETASGTFRESYRATYREP